MRNKNQKEYFEIDGHDYYIDINAISDMIRIEENDSEIMDYVLSMKYDEEETSETIEKENVEKPTEKEIQEFMNEPLYVLDTVKLDFIRMMVDTVLNAENKDGKLDFEREMSYGFKLSFNTLLKNDIIKES